LNGLQAILGSEVLMNPEKVKSLSPKSLTITTGDKDFTIPIQISDMQRDANNRITISSEDPLPIMNSRQSPPTEPITDSMDILDSRHSSCNCQYTMPSNIELPVYHSKIVTKETETLPPADELFHETIELDFKSLDKQFSIKDADFSDCPPQELPKIKTDRFSTTKLDIETTTLYEAELPTMPGKKVCQPLRRLPPHKFAFAMKAIKQLEAAKVISNSDSTWRSNVVLVPKPVSSNEI
jgi:hypothetical protein